MLPYTASIRQMSFEEVKEKKGILHEKKYTEYSRVILALTALGEDVTNVGGV